jgi:hypothetical protein
MDTVERQQNKSKLKVSMGRFSALAFGLFIALLLPLEWSATSRESHRTTVGLFYYSSKYLRHIQCKRCQGVDKIEEPNYP